jgi:hypothetical protein
MLSAPWQHQRIDNVILQLIHHIYYALKHKLQYMVENIARSCAMAETLKNSEKKWRV